MDLVHFGLESGMVFEGTTGVHERTLRFIFQMNKKKWVTCEFEKDFKNFSVSVLLQNYIAKSGAIDVNQSSLVKLN